MGKKPAGYHLDLMVLGSIIYPIVSFLGLPFPCAATVRSVAHQNALTTFEDRPLPGGGSQKIASKVIETRWTGFAIHVLLALSTCLSPVLKHLPKGVLFGVFLYMGVSSIPGNQLFERVALWGIWKQSDYPQYPYLANVPIKGVHLFTAVQIICFAILYWLKSNKDTSVGFPFFIAGLIVLRRFFSRMFTEDVLAALDGEAPSLPRIQPDPEKAEAPQTEANFEEVVEEDKRNEM